MTAPPKTHEDDLASDLDGIDPAQRDEILAAFRGHDAVMAGEEFEVWPENWETVQIFLSLATQWNFTSSGEIIGLRYEAVFATMRLLNVATRKMPAIFQNLRIMEASALREIRKRGRK